MMAWLVVMRLELWVRRGCPRRFHFLELMSSLHVPASGTVPLAPTGSCRDARCCSNVCVWGRGQGCVGLGTGDYREAGATWWVWAGEALPALAGTGLPLALSPPAFIFVYNTSHKGEQHPGSQSLVHSSSSTVERNLGDRKESHSFIHSLTHSVHF